MPPPQPVVSTRSSLAILTRKANLAMWRHGRQTMKAKRWLQIAGMILGSFLVISSMVVMTGVTLSLVRARATVAQSGDFDARAIASHLGDMILAGVAAVVFLPIGGMVFTLSFVAFQKLRRSTPLPLPEQTRTDPH
jgi:hypothetical protein